MKTGDYDTVTIETSKTLYRPDGRAAILLTGHRRPTEPFSVAFEVTLETCAILRKELAKAELHLATAPGRA